jgi:hypothetical protein
MLSEIFGLRGINVDCARDLVGCFAVALLGSRGHAEQEARVRVPRIARERLAARRARAAEIAAK